MNALKIEQNLNEQQHNAKFLITLTSMMQIKGKQKLIATAVSDLCKFIILNVNEKMQKKTVNKKTLVEGNVPFFFASEVSEYLQNEK